MSYLFFLFLVEAFRNGDIIFVGGYPHQHPDIHQYKPQNPMAKKQRPIPLDDVGITELDPDSIVSIVEKNGLWYPVAHKELLGHEIRMEVRAIVYEYDAKGFEHYKELKADASNRESRVAAYAFLLYRFFTRTATEYDNGFHLRLSIVDLSTLHPEFRRANLTELSEKEAVKYIIKYFLAETYITTHL
jgi:hypothetical protein